MRTSLRYSALRARGFTLIELMIVVVVVAVLAAIAYPSFMDSVRKGRRSEAMAALAAIQQAQERWRGGNAAYTTALGDLRITTPTSSGYYSLTLAAPVAAGATLANGYVAIAEGRAGTTQAGDTKCRKIGVQVAGGTITYGGCTGCGSLTFSNTSACWSR